MELSNKHKEWIKIAFIWAILFLLYFLIYGCSPKFQKDKEVIHRSRYHHWENGYVMPTDTLKR